jgi:hypothetical protein
MLFSFYGAHFHDYFDGTVGGRVMLADGSNLQLGMMRKESG